MKSRHTFRELCSPFAILFPFATAKSVLFHAEFAGPELQTAKDLQYEVTSLDKESWRRLTTDDFRKYDALAISLDGKDDVKSSQLYETRQIWGGAVRGNIVGLGNCSTLVPDVMRKGLEYAAGADATGLYITIPNMESEAILDKLLVPEIVAFDRGLLPDSARQQIEVMESSEGRLKPLTSAIPDDWKCYGDFAVSSDPTQSEFPRRAGFNPITYRTTPPDTSSPRLVRRSIDRPNFDEIDLEKDETALEDEDIIIKEPAYNPSNDTLTPTKHLFKRARGTTAANLVDYSRHPELRGRATPHGDDSHFSSAKVPTISSHGWWTVSGYFTPEKAWMSIWLQTRPIGYNQEPAQKELGWRSVGYHRAKKRYGGGSASRVTGRQICANLDNDREWRSIVSLDVTPNGDDPHPVGLKTSVVKLKCGIEPHPQDAVILPDQQNSGGKVDDQQDVEKIQPAESEQIPKDNEQIQDVNQGEDVQNQPASLEEQESAIPIQMANVASAQSTQPQGQQYEETKIDTSPKADQGNYLNKLNDLFGDDEW
ncbi:hypothetical protein ABW19_dt0201977 [Dactylella cylindrospora]|nr:hypothetical protein ABW19_dt0201977 [Dactylella cylindrospora]